MIKNELFINLIYFKIIKKYAYFSRTLEEKITAHYGTIYLISFTKG